MPKLPGALPLLALALFAVVALALLTSGGSHRASAAAAPCSAGERSRSARTVSDHGVSPELIGTDPPEPTGPIDLEAALGRLSPLTRSVLWLHDVEGYTHEEIGEMMVKTASFSKSQLSRAHKRLREWLE